MNAYTTSRAARWATLPVLVIALLACTGGDLGQAPAAGEVTAAAPAVPATTDTIRLRDLGYSRGSTDAPVVVYEFADFGCPFCGMFALGTYPELHEEFVKTGRVRWVMVPFVMGMFPNGAEAARAGECAGEQGRFWPMHNLLFANQKEWKASRSPARLFQEYAGRLKLDAKRFATCYEENRRGGRTALNNRAADAAGIRATPSFLVGGRLVEGALPAEQFRLLLKQLTASRP